MILDVPAIIEHPGKGRLGRGKNIYICLRINKTDSKRVTVFLLSFSLSASRTKPQHRSPCSLTDADNNAGHFHAFLLGVQAEQWLLPETQGV